jgi:hypothetical protein
VPSAAACGTAFFAKASTVFSTTFRYIASLAASSPSRWWIWPSVWNAFRKNIIRFQAFTFWLPPGVPGIAYAGALGWWMVRLALSRKLGR